MITIIITKFIEPFPYSPMALYNKKRNRKVNLTYL